MSLIRHFRAKSNMTIGEAERRMAAACAEPVERAPLPLSILAERLAGGALHQDELASSVFGAEPESLAPGAVDRTGVAAVALATAPAAGTRDPASNTDEAKSPVVTITITGLPYSGKSALAHLIRAALAREGIVVSGPEGLHSMQWRRSIDRLINRDGRVELQEAEPGSEEADRIVYGLMSDDWRIALDGRLGEVLPHIGEVR